MTFWHRFSTRLAIPVVAVCLAQLGLSTPGAAVTGRLQIAVGGLKRSAILVDPERLKRTPRTAIIVLHGGTNGSGRRIQASLGLDEAIRNAGIVAVYPDAFDGRWNITGDSSGPDDPAFLRALAAKLVTDGVADRRRIFLVGVSTGGMLALRVGCQSGDYLAGVGALIAALPASLAASCKPGPLAVMVMNGTANPLVPYQGGKADLNVFKDDVLSAEATVAPFAAASGCGTQRTVHEIPDRDPSDGSRVVIERLNGCRQDVELVRVEGGGHTLPGRPARADRGQVVGALNRDIAISRVIAEFVRHASH